MNKPKLCIEIKYGWDDGELMHHSFNDNVDDAIKDLKELKKLFQDKAYLKEVNNRLLIQQEQKKKEKEDEFKDFLYTEEDFKRCNNSYDRENVRKVKRISEPEKQKSEELLPDMSDLFEEINSYLKEKN